MPGFDEIKNTNTATENTSQAKTETKRDNDTVREARGDLQNARKSMMASVGRRLVTTASNQYLDQVDKGIRETLEELHEVKDEIEVIKVGSSALRYPAIAVAQKFLAKGREVIAYFMFPIQDRSSQLERKGREDRGGRKDVPPVPTDVIDNKFFNAVEQSVRDYYKAGDNVEIICAGTQILGELFKLDYKEHPEGYVKLVFAAIGQTDAVRFKQTGDTGAIIQASNLEDDSVLVGRIDYSPSINEDLAGNPIRSDIHLTIVEQKRRIRGKRGNDEDNGSYNGEVGLNQTLISVDAAVNFIFTDNDDDNRGRSRDEYPQKFLPELRITNIENRLNPSIANFIYAISHIAAVAQGERWVNAFAPNLLRNRPGRNLGGLYAEQPDRDEPFEPVDLSEGNLDDVYDMAKHCCQKDVLVTVMASESSEYSRIFDQLYTMASNPISSPEYLEAYDDMMNEIEVMLGKELDWSDRDPIFAGDQLHRNLIGYYQDGNEVFSTEDIDYLSIVNCGKGLKPLQTAQDWDSSFSVNDYDEGTTTRARIVAEETDNMVKWTGAQNTLSISMEFLNVFNRALNEVGLGIEIEDNSNSSDRRVRRPMSGFSNFAGRGEGFGRRRDDRRDDRSRRSRGGRGRYSR